MPWALRIASGHYLVWEIESVNEIIQFFEDMQSNSIKGGFVLQVVKPVFRCNESADRLSL